MTTRLVVLCILAFGGMAVQAGEDCFNSESQWKMTGNEPENLRITDADLETLHQSIAAHEAAQQAEAERRAEEAAARATAAVVPAKEGG